jgi:hypothetical protein
MAAKRRFKFATFNLKNLASPGVSIYGKRVKEADYKSKVAWTGAMIRALDAEFIGFQEAWSDQALREAFDAAYPPPAPGSRSRPPKYKLFFAGADGVLARTAAATTLPIIGTPEVITDFPRPITIVPAETEQAVAVTATKFRRPVLKVTVNVRDTPVTVFVAHLKSKRPDYLKPPGADFPPEEAMLTADLYERILGNLRALVSRACEAATLRLLVNQTATDNANPVIVLGDLNDAEGAVTTDMVEGEEPYRYYTALTNPATDKRYTSAEAAAIRFRLWDVKLYSAEQIQSRRSLVKTVYSHIYNGRYESLDHILVSQEFYYRNSKRLGVLEYFHAFNDFLVDESIGGQPINEHASDHAPLVATILMGKEED